MFVIYRQPMMEVKGEKSPCVSIKVSIRVKRNSHIIFWVREHYHQVSSEHPEALNTPDKTSLHISQKIRIDFIMLTSSFYVNDQKQTDKSRTSKSFLFLTFLNLILWSSLSSETFHTILWNLPIKSFHLQPLYVFSPYLLSEWSLVLLCWPSFSC